MAKRPRAIKGTLTPDVIVDAAARVVESEGAGALSMRRLGEELGVAAMAIYNHIQSREAVLDLLAERILTGVEAELEDPGEMALPHDRVARILRGVCRVAIARPNGFAVAISRPVRPAATTRLMVDGLKTLRLTGMSGDAAVAWYHTALMVLQGFPAWCQNHKAAAEANKRKGQGATSQARTPDAGLLLTAHAVSADEQLARSVDLLLSLLPPRKRLSA